MENKNIIPEHNVENMILNAAKTVFMRKGFHGARMQEIADEAKINKAMLHYYFRSKEKLFRVIFDNSFKQLLSVMLDILDQEMEFEDKVRVFVERYIRFLIENPLLAPFIINEINQNIDGVEKFFTEKFSQIPMKFGIEISKLIADGKIKPIDPRHLIINLLSACLFPFVAKPLLIKRVGLKEEEFNGFMEDRIKILPDLILNGVLNR